MRKRKTYSKEFKEEAIRLVKEDGLTCIQVERDLNGVQREFTSLCPACHLISRVDNLVQLMGEFVDLKFFPERQVIADLFFPLFWCDLS